MLYSCFSLVIVVWLLSHVQLFATLCTVACQASLSVGFLRQEYWNGLPCPSPRYLPDPGIEPVSPVLAGRFFTAEPMSPPLQKLSPPAQA